MKGKKHGFALIMGGIYALLSLGLLVSFSGAKYTDQRTAYPAFQAANFNVAILLEDPDTQQPEAQNLSQIDGDGESSQPSGESSEPTSESTTEPTQDTTQTIQVELSHIRPGMVEETAQKIDFYVSNGIKGGDIAGVDIQYTIRVRTEENLPLTYSLKVPGETETATYSSQEVKSAEGEEPSTWKELQFGSENQEATFSLVSRPLGSFTSNAHTLVVEWPVEQGDVKYMKEVEVIEILVTAHSVNRLEEADYIVESLPTEAVEDTYTPGVILLKQPEGSESAMYPYTIDLRAFQPGGEDGSRTFQFRVDNAVQYQFTQSRRYIDYSFQLLVPLERVEPTELGGTVSYEPLKLNFAFDDGGEMTASSYRIKDEKTGQWVTDETGNLLTYNTLESIPDLTNSPEQRPYALYTAEGKQLENATQDATLIWHLKSDTYTHWLTISGDDVAKITDTPLEDDFSFLNKLELEVTASFTGADISNTAAPTQPGDAEETTAPSETAVPGE